MVLSIDALSTRISSWGESLIKGDIACKKLSINVSLLKVTVIIATLACVILISSFLSCMLAFSCVYMMLWRCLFKSAYLLLVNTPADIVF